MGFLDSYKITSAEQAAAKVQSAPDTLSGSAQDNKKVFDNFPDLIASKFNALVENVLLESYPVGSIYISTNNTNPQTIFGGTWTSFGEGRTLIGVDASDADFSTSQKTGGAKTHKLTKDEMPSHYHSINSASEGQAYSSGTRRNTLTGGTVGSTTRETGGDQPHNNMQPYITVYMWRRTA
jgi:hypothetical protein